MGRISACQRATTRFPVRINAVAARASQITDLARGLTVRVQMGTPRKTFLEDAEEAADLVLLPRRGIVEPRV